MQTAFGIEKPQSHHQPAEMPPVRYLVLIHDAATDSRVARLFLDDRKAVAEFDAGAPEVQMMIADLASEVGAQGPEWDQALGGHSAQERSEAEVFTMMD